jgi:serine carboxypeptidase-like clade 1
MITIMIISSRCLRLLRHLPQVAVLILLARVVSVQSSVRSSLLGSSDGVSGGQLQCLQYHPDRMKSFPGWNQPLPSAWFSGYLDYELPGTGTSIHTHYVLVQGEEGPADDSNNSAASSGADGLPLIYWSNGGPCASSLFGLLTEIGPLILSDLSLTTDDYRATGIPSPQYNQYSWTRLGWILLIDQPAPVGFSYCNDNHTSHACGNISWTDELASLNAWTALQTFYTTKFPCLQSKDLYLTGESYAGIYIPTLARRIVQSNSTRGTNEGGVEDRSASSDSAVFVPPLKGFAVGDGCLGKHTSMCGGLGNSDGFADYWHIWFMAGHHQMPLQDFRMVLKACSHADEPGFLTNSGARWEDDALCKAALAKTKKELGGFFEYALYDDCTYRNGLKWKQRLAGLDLLFPSSGSDSLDKMFRGAMNDYPCGGGPVMEEYLKLPIVLEAFHVRSDFFEVDNAMGFDYTPTEPDLQPFYKDVQGKLKVPYDECYV